MTAPVLTTATADTSTGRRIRDLLNQLTVIHSPRFAATHTPDEINTAARAVWDGIAAAAIPEGRTAS